MIPLDDTLVLEPVRVPIWAWIVLTAALVGAYALTIENGAVLAAHAQILHELFHDARHFVGVPCH